MTRIFRQRIIGEGIVQTGSYDGILSAPIYLSTKETMGENLDRERKRGRGVARSG